jgi:hypothetical protein
MPKQPQEEPQFDPAQEIGFDDQDAWDAAPDEAKDHLMRAFLHHAGLGPHPGKIPHEIDYEGECDDDEDETSSIDEDFGLAPDDFEEQEIKQQVELERELEKQATMQGAEKARQPQAQQAPVNAPQAPPGPQPTTAPCKGQRRKKRRRETTD